MPKQATERDPNHPETWKFTSPEQPGLHLVISPENSACRKTWIYRLNLRKGSHHRLDANTLNVPGAPEGLELNAMIASGSVRIDPAPTEATEAEAQPRTLERLDSWYQTPADGVTVEALKDAMLYVGGAPYTGKGSFYLRPYDSSLPLGEIRQVHGKPPYRRDVFMTVDQETEASTMINGITWGDDGGWTSWPPHEHTEHLEEVYCYFDIPAPRYALHFASRKPAMVEAIHRVSTGDCVIVPEGYHPTAACPGTRSCYFWVMAAHRPESRRYDLAVPDPAFPVE
ncbi:MAG: 5-deoxy-glucuronate isomerase [Spirochaetaceae bacterium]